MPVVSCGHCAKPVTLPDEWASPGFTCPHCHRTTAFAAPAPLPLPSRSPEPLPLPDDEASQPVRVPRTHVAAAPRTRPELEAGGKGLIVVGYAAFVLIPAAAVIALAVYKFGGDEKPNNTPTAQHSDDKDPVAKKPEPGPKRGTPRPHRNDKRAEDPDDPPPPSPRGTGKKSDSTPPDPIPNPEPAATIAIAPEPRPARVVTEVPIPEPVAIAPEPRVIRPGFAPPPGSFNSDWEQVDEVEARVAGVAIMHVPITDADGRAVDSPVAVLTVWVEVRTRTVARMVELKRWQDSFGSYAEVTTARGLQMGRALLGPAASLRTALPYRQVVPPDGTARTDIVVFSAPPDDAGDLRLVLDAERVGEKGKFKITIPAKALKK
jgi:hypothetical protein